MKYKSNMLRDVKVITDRLGKRRVYVNGKRAKRLGDGNSPTGYVGINKVVYMQGEFIVKFTHRAKEATIEFSPEDREFFAQVLYVAINKEWYVQEKVDCEPNYEVTPTQTHQARRIANKYGITDISDMWVDRINRTLRVGHNYTIDKIGKLKIYDYEGY